MTVIDEVAEYIAKGGGTVVMVGLAAISLSYDMWLNIRRWFVR
jgi:hypothetical protein